MDYLFLQRIVFKNKNDYQITQTYEIFDKIQKIGIGANCVAYKARSRSNGAYVVIKELLPKRYRRRVTRSNRGFAIIEGENFENEKRKFIEEYYLHQEIQQSNTFTGNNNALIYAGGNTLYIVMSYDGEPLTENDLKDFITECSDNSVDYVKIILSELKKYAEEICDIHSNAKCVLLDIKPENLILTKKGLQLSYRRIIDYGSFQKIEDLEKNQYEISSNELAPPEVRNKQYSLINTCSDVFLFGNTVLYFLTGNIIDRYLLRQRPMEEFKEILINKYDKFNILRNKSEHFWVMLHNFFDFTLSDEILDNISIDEVKVLMNEKRRETTVRKRVKSMNIVIYMLTLLAGDSLYPELEEQFIRTKISETLRKFSDEEYYGMPTEKKNKYLFSEILLPIFQESNEQLTTKELMKQLFTKNGAYYISGQSGTGKSTTMKYIACQTEKIEDLKVPIPIYVRMTELVFFKSIYQYLSEKLFGKATNEDVQEIYDEELEKYFDGVNNRAKLLIFFDGLNEIGYYQNAKKIINECQNIAKRNNVTAVFSGHDQKIEHPHFKGTILRLNECTEDQVKNYLENLTKDGFLFWKPQNLQEITVKRTLKSLHTPMLAHCFAARFFKINPIDESQLPANEALLIEQYLFSFGTNSIYERIQETFSEERIRVVPYADFLIKQVVAKLCLDMTVKKSKTVSKREILHTIENGLGVFNNNDGSITRRIGEHNISNDDYEKMIAIDNASWLSFLFTTCTDGDFEVIHSKIGFYLAAKYLCECIKNTEARNINSFPECIWQLSLPEELWQMTAMLMSCEKMKMFCRKFKRIYGSIVKRFFKKQVHDITMSDDIIVLDSGTVANFETAGYNIRKIIDFMDIPKYQKTKLKKGLLDNKTDRILTKVFHVSNSKLCKLSEEETTKLGSVVREISRDSQALYLARWLWSIQNDIFFKNKISVFIYACKQIEKMVSDFLESKQLSGSQASDILGIFIGYQALFPQKFTKIQLIKECTECDKIDVSIDILEKLSDFLDDMEIFKLCPRLINTFGAIKFLKMIRDNCKENQYSQIVTEPLSSELLHEVSLVACAEWDFNDRDYYPERIYSKFSSQKHDIYQKITEEKQGKLLLNVQEIESSSDISLLIRQFCLVEYEIHNIGDKVTASKEQLFALSQLYTMINYSISKKTGRMVHTNFSLSDNRIRCDSKINIIDNPDILTALIGLKITDAVPWYGIRKFFFYYIKNFQYGADFFSHLSPKEYIFFIVFGIMLVCGFVSHVIINPTFAPLSLLILLFFYLVFTCGEMIFIIFYFYLEKTVTFLTDGLFKLFNR